MGSVIPAGAYFARWNGTAYEGVLSGGASFPAVFQDKDIFLYGDYAYRYGRDYDDNIVADGWSAVVAVVNDAEGINNTTFPEFAFNDKSTFDNAGLICESINGKEIKSLYRLFNECPALRTFANGFQIPSDVTVVTGIFRSCSSLEELPAGFTIPDNVTAVDSMFANCTSLEGLHEGFTIPGNVTAAMSMFYNCTALEELPAGFAIPSGMTNIMQMFYGCGALASLPSGFTVPSGVTQMERVFWNCYMLSDTITINANPTSYSSCFKEAGKDTTDGIVLKGSSTVLNDLAAEKGDNGKVTVAP